MFATGSYDPKLDWTMLGIGRLAIPSPNVENLISSPGQARLWRKAFHGAGFRVSNSLSLLAPVETKQNVVLIPHHDKTAGPLRVQPNMHEARYIC